MNDDTAFTNRLANETSPYLLQHAHNPVDWYPWGDEALARARTEDKPILLSIGYSACHWCHVMAHESFENAETAALMNELFVNVKVDREERPDLDNIYMQAVQLLTHSGGWPLTVFLKPDGAPFYGGTYFPPADRYGMPSFSTVLHAISDAYQSRRAEVEKSAAQLVDALRTAVSLPDVAGSIDQETLDEACANIARTFDGRLGGFGRAPKFPAGMVMDFLLRHHARTARPDALFMVELTLEKMARGGIYDQIGGGFARYSVDERWLVPHFEKMLYDNAILARNYLDAHRITNKPFYRRIVEETLDFVIREMMSPVGAFYSAYDADSEGHEGKFYVWEPDEVNAVLGQPDGHLFCAFYDVSKEGNFEGKNILNVPRTLDEVAVAERVDPEHLHQVLERGRRELYAVRSKRVWPGLDDKALAAWNGLMLRAFAEAGGALDRMDYVDVARRNAEFILESMRDGKKLLRTYKDGAAKLNAYLEDYAFVIEGLVSLYEATFETRWLVEAKNLADVMIAEFWDESADGFFFTGSSHEQLLRRTKEFEDNATPSGNSSAANGLLRLAELTSEESYRTYADRVLNVTAGALGRYARAFGHMLCAADFRLAPPMEIAIVGEPEDDATHALSREARAHYVAARVLAGSRPGDEEAATIVPLLRDRGLVDGMPAAHVCRNFACKLPVTDVEALREDLDAG